jgi:hypothetical protein
MSKKEYPSATWQSFWLKLLEQIKERLYKNKPKEALQHLEQLRCYLPPDVRKEYDLLREKMVKDLYNELTILLDEKGYLKK